MFCVYSEAAGTTVKDTFNMSRNSLYNGNMAEDGYIYISIYYWGTPAPTGAHGESQFTEKLVWLILIIKLWQPEKFWSGIL